MSGKPGSSDKAKTVVYTRFSPESIAALDKITAEHPLKPNRARLIEAAVDEYIAKHSKPTKKESG